MDLREDDSPMPVIHEMTDGMQFDLGGGRIVTAYDCPGHSPGEMVFLDSATRTLFAGDAVNYNLGVGRVPLETTLRYMKRLQAMGDQYDGIYNGHHDFRPLGAPLDDDCLPTIIEIMEDVLAGHMNECQVPDFWGQDVILTAEKPVPEPGRPKRVMLRKGRNFLAINPDNLYENKQ